MPHATVDGSELYYELRGSGQPLLLIQGMSGTHLSWGEPFLAELERDFEVLIYDHRGVGHSSRVDDPFTIEALADDAAGLMDVVGWESAHVLGISMGGMVAQELALRHPDKVRTLALGCTYAGGPDGQLTTPEVGQRLMESVNSGDRERALRTMYDINVSAAFASDAARFDPFHEMATALPVPVAVIMLQVQAIGGHDTSERLSSLDVPTLVIHGDEDQMLPVANGRAIAGRVAGARYEELAGVGHMFWWEQPQRSAELVREHALASAAT
jgi:pimeloyl-ACP methyl ester carboxylesterase